MQKSAEIMKLSNQLVKLPEISKVMREMSSEMMKAGIMEEMMEDTLDSGILGEDEDELEEEAQGEVDKVLWELTDGELELLGERTFVCLLLTLNQTILAAFLCSDALSLSIRKTRTSLCY